MLAASIKLFLFHLCASCCFLFSRHVVEGATAYPFSFSFDFSDRSSYRSADLKFEGDAVQRSELVDLTCNSMALPFKNTGRVSYKYPVPFYDTTTGEVASFTTRFTFAIKAGKVRGDGGMAFFLTGYPSRLPLTSRGGDPGLLHGGPGRFVAVEFDTYRNTFDPCDTHDHISIHIDTARDSLNATCLRSLSLEGSMTASITFNSSTNMLLASLHLNTHPSRGSYQVSMHLPHPVTSLLPSEVAVGFSPATGSSFDYHQILSWSFDSTLATRTETGASQAQPKPAFVVSRKYRTGRILAQFDDSSVPPPPDQSTEQSNSGSDPTTTTPTGTTVQSKPTSPLTIVVVFLVIVIFIVVIWFGVAAYKHTHRGDSFMKGARDLAKRFEYQELVVATDKFSRELGQGAFGVVYKGRMTDQDDQQHQVAVKKLKSCDGKTNDFHAELKTISETRHKNLVRLKGWCSRKRINLIDFMCWWRQKLSVELFLVYELVPNGSLDVHLNGKEERVLPWTTRYIPNCTGCKLIYLLVLHLENDI
uniref:Uncharacterized protein n=1 Tax=Avena sativa TaxID=4498 RepID=A0ACD5W3C3_AVESA